MAFGAIAVVVVIVVVLVLVKVVGGGSNGGNSASTGPAVVPAQASVLAAVNAVTPSEAATVGLPSSVGTPQVAKNQPALESGGKPEALFIGGLFCPYCAAERWALVMTFDRFGSFSGLKETTSSPYDTDPSTATFDFDGATYTSSDVVFTPVEHDGNDTTALGTRTTLEPLTSAESSLWSKYEAMFGEPEGFPFIDIGNKVFVVSPSYDPATLAGLNQSAIAANLDNPNSAVTQDIVGTANYLTAGVCAVDGEQPAMWCGSSAIKAAAASLGLS